MIDSKFILTMEGVKKRFGATRALRGANLQVRQQEVHAIVGSNGAGKSTLMKILSGEYIPDEGTLIYQGEAITGLSPKQIQQKGIEVVHQELNIVGSLSILENILLACPPALCGFTNWKAGEAMVQDVLNLIGVDFDLHREAGSLSISQQQFVILARAIIRKPALLVLDEPTSRIGMEETKKLFSLIGLLKKHGTTTLYISHRIEEIYQICDRISVFRDGLEIVTRTVSDLPENELVSLMLGKQLEIFFPKISTKINGEILRINDLHCSDKVHGVSLSIKRGEIVSLVGAVGSGKSEILNTIYGIEKIRSGEILIGGVPVKKNHSPERAVKNNVALIPEDRALQGMIGNYSVKNNITSIRMKHITSCGMISRRKEDLLAQRLIDTLSVVPDDIHYIISALSGGNQQKVIVGKWLTDPYRIYLLDEVTAGVDIGAKADIYTLIGNLVEKGAGILISTGDIEEAMGLSDRILVLYKGRIIKELTPRDAAKEEVLYYIMGGNRHEIINE